MRQVRSWIPGKLRARPVQHPATPALMTAKREAWLKYKQARKVKEPVQIWGMSYHHPSLAASSESRQPNCVLQIELQMSNTTKLISGKRNKN
jgi:hypothetical protein